MTATLQERLERAECDLVSADMIDSFPRREREVARIKGLIQHLKREIAHQQSNPERAS